MIGNGKYFYDNLLEAHTTGPASALPRAVQDYAVLAQGEANTRLRHKEVSDWFRAAIHGNSLLDLGCGTGLLLEHLHAEGIVPSRYVGVDYLEARSHLFYERADALLGKGRGTFRQADVAELVAHPMAASLGAFDVCVAVGLVGNAPFHTISRIANLVLWMQGGAPHGIVTLPRQYDGKLGEPDQAHFDPEDIAIHFAARRIPYSLGQHSSREVSLGWTL